MDKSENKMVKKRLMEITIQPTPDGGFEAVLDGKILGGLKPSIVRGEKSPYFYGTNHQTSAMREDVKAKLWAKEEELDYFQNKEYYIAKVFLVAKSLNDVPNKSPEIEELASWFYNLVVRQKFNIVPY